MRYSVGPYLIHSEYSAKSMRQPSRETVAWIRSRAERGEVLDYGCGKLRYAVHLAPRCRSLTLVDSEEQMLRIQRIGNQRCTIPHFVSAHWVHARCLSLSEFASDTQTYELALCSNVLSAIPDEAMRMYALLLIAERLKPGGEALFVTQYRNSYFNYAKAQPNARPYLDGWILDTPRGSFFYGLIPLAKLEQLIRSSGLAVSRSWVQNGSAYAVGTPR